jgi:hypothetical protein
MSRKLRVIGFVFLLSASPAAAQETNQATPAAADIERAYFLNESYRTYVDMSFNDLEPEPLKAGCLRLKILEHTRHAIVRPLQFTKTSTGYSITGGVWIAVPEIERCGRIVKRRVLMAIDSPNHIDPAPLLPGDFRGNLKLEVDARRIVLPGILGKATCQDRKSLHVLDIVNTGSDGNGNWTETWTAQACGKTVTPSVRYTKDATGTLIEANFPAE